MKHFIKLFLFLWAVSFLCAETQVSISASAGLATIGDQVNLKILAKTSLDIQDINISTSQDDFEIVAEKETVKRKEKDYVVFEKNLTIAFFKIGDFDIEPFTITLLKGKEVVETKTTNSVPITVKSVLREEDKDIKPLKNLIELKGNPFYILKYVIVFLIIVLVVVLVVLWLKKRSQGAVPAEQPLLSPVEEFETGIDRLWEQNLFEKGKTKLFFIQLTKIMKRFLYRKYGFNAEDYTTYETLYYLKRVEQEVSLLDNMDYIMDTSDLVKFAKFVPQSNVPVDIHARIKEMIAFYKRREAPPAPAGNPKNDDSLRK
ncbi:MAG: hypothetical protein KAW12_05015 [Candidatus Aminicenantes bacterium]|nr:hypothetical protein [Candidatus Aminicenantes bacterium]